MTRTSWLSVVSCTALVVGALAAGCADPDSGLGGTGGSTTGVGGRGTGGTSPIGVGGMGVGGRGMGGMTVVDAGPRDTGGPRDAGGPTGCNTGATCTTGCTQTCNGGAGTRACTCSAAGTLMCPTGAGSCMVDGGTPMDAGGPTGCNNGAACTAGCTQTCNLGGGRMGTRDCTCGTAGTLMCPTWQGTCMAPDGGGPG